MLPSVHGCIYYRNCCYINVEMYCRLLQFDFHVRGNRFYFNPEEDWVLCETFLTSFLQVRF